jgi:hypothetical protein
MPRPGTGPPAWRGHDPKEGLVPDREQQRIADVEARMARLEAQLEALQDAVHRTTVRQDHRLDELQRQLDPATISRALSDDARRRGI